MDAAASILWVASVVIFVFAVVYAISTVTLIVLSLVEVTSIKIERGEAFSPPARLRSPGISIIAAAYNTEPLIVANARSLLASDYEPLEVLIVDDGSEDGTTTALQRRFDLVELPVGDRLLIATAPIEQLFVSRIDPRLRVVRKANGGRADAINAFAGEHAGLADRKAEAVLTPHLGELARLLGRPAGDRLSEARSLALEVDAVTLLKGTRSVIAAPDGSVRVNPTGSPALATAGTGDVLTGAIGGLLARGVEPFAAAWAGAYLHGLAGILAAGPHGEGIVAGDVAARLPAAIARVEEGR